MNKEEILAMEAGKGLDVLVADKVMGWEVHEGYCISENGLRSWVETSYKGFSPSTDISAAWEVLEKMQTEWSWEMNMLNAAKEVDVRIGKRFATSKSVPEAICKAALLALIDS